MLFNNTYTEIIFHRMNNDDHLEINVMLFFKLIKLRFKIPYIEVMMKKGLKPAVKVKSEVSKISENKSLLTFDELKKIYDKFKIYYPKYKKILDYIISKTSIQSLIWNSKIGIGDAALTALASGAAWALKGNIMAFIMAKKNPSKIYFHVHPDYYRVLFETDFNCIISIRIANIIIAGIKIVCVFIINKIKGGEGYERSSNSRSDENYHG
ncbi:DUF2953 domain-containing protein [Oxobacter pfennigii]|uniref:DUF2953 domain-containing protein n=1 Tax=Oxobacter pfennigii TaxID=36849 RepID=UPI001364C12E|nr:DUF2953 domain-containing protein [Oxobacter pfennigii]